MDGTDRSDGAQRQDFGVLVNLAGVVFLDELVAHLVQSGFPGFTVRTGWVIRSVGADAISLRDLAERMGLSSPGTLKAIEPMIAAGYLARATTSDRRVRAVEVTDLGWAAQSTARAFHDTFEATLAETVGVEDAAATRRGLEALVARGARTVPAALDHP